MKKALGYTFLTILTLFILFYFWGSSEKLDQKEYTEIQTFNAEGAPLKDTLSICTYNIGYLSGMTNNRAVDRSKQLFDTNLEKASQLLSTIAPDIVAFQEIDFDSKRSFYVNQLEEVATKCGYSYGAKAINWDKNYVPFPYWPPSMHFGSMLSGQGIISKFNIANNEIHVLEKPVSNPFYYNAFYLERLAQVAELTIRDQKLIVINIHLEAFAPETRENQGKYILNLFNKYAKDYPVLLVGDFNSTPPFASKPYQTDKTMRFFLENENIGAAITKGEYLKNENEHFTFDSESPYIKIDYILYNKDKIAPISARVVKEAGDISDHLPVYFSFVLK